MKSVVEEASSILKAIEKGWMSAGQPKEFTVKIFEEPQRNFIGLTVRSAKVAILFNDEHLPKTETQQKPRTQKAAQPPVVKEQPKQPTKLKQRELKTTTARQKVDEQLIESKEIAVQESTPTAPQQPIWTESMLEVIKQWTQETLSMLNVGTIAFNLDPQHFHLKIYFATALYEDKSREKQLFSSLSTLFLQMLKHRHSRPLKGYKIIFITP